MATILPSSPSPFDEAVANFSNTDLTVAGGTLDTLTTSDNITWTATFTASDDSTTDASVTVNAGGYEDSVGNTGNSDSDSISVDTKNPTPTVAFSESSLNDGNNTSLVTITFDEAVANFSNTDLTVAGGTLDTLTTSDNITWTATFTASDDSTTDASSP